MPMENSEKNRRQLDLLLNLELRETAPCVYASIDQEAKVVLAISSEHAAIRFIPDVLPDVATCMAFTSLTNQDIFSSLHVLNKNAGLSVEKAPASVVNFAIKEKQLRAQYALVAFSFLHVRISRARHLLAPAHALDPLVQTQIELELFRHKAGDRSLSGYVSSYAEIHGLSQQAAWDELNLSVETARKELQCTQELFWRFKKRIVANPPTSVRDLQELNLQMRTEFSLAYRI